MALGEISKAPTSGRISQPLSRAKRRFSQVDQDSDDQGPPRRVESPQLNPEFLQAGRQDNIDAYQSGTRNTTFQSHGGSSLRDSGDEYDPWKYATADRLNGTIELSDDRSYELAHEDDREMPDADGADDGPRNMFFAAAPNTLAYPQGAGSVDTGNTTQTRTIQPLARSQLKAMSKVNSDAKVEANSNPSPWFTDDSSGNLGGSIMVGVKQKHLRNLAAQIPSALLGKGKIGKHKIWVGALQYMDQLHGVTARITSAGQYKNNLKKPRMQRILAKFVQDRCQFKPHRVSPFEHHENVVLLAEALATYFNECNKAAVQPSSKKATTGVQNDDSKVKDSSNASNAVTVQDGPATTSFDQSESTEHKGATGYIRELSVASPPREISVYYHKRYPEGYHYIHNLPTESTSAGEAGAMKLPGKVDVEPNSKRQRVESARLTRDIEQVGTICSHMASKPASEPVIIIKSEECEDNKTNVITAEAPNDVDAGAEIVAKAMEALQQSIMGAMNQKLEWDNVPVALFDAEMGTRRVQKAIDEAKDVVAKHGYQIKRT